MKKRLLLYYFLLFICLSSCNKQVVDISIESDKLGISSHPIGPGFLHFNFETDIAVMGLVESPSIELEIPSTFNDSKIEFVFVFGAVGGPPEIKIEDGQAYPKNNTTFPLLFQLNMSNLEDIRFNVPGLWKLRAIVFYDGYVYYSDVVDMEITFPSAEDMKYDEDLYLDMEDLWQQALDSTTTSGRYEWGFWVYAYINSDNELKFHAGEDFHGTKVTGCLGSQGRIAPGTPEIIEQPSNPDDTDVKYYIGFFHTHTSLHYCNNVQRTTGISDKDIQEAKAMKLPILLYDYEDNPITRGDHSKYDAYGLSWTEEVEQRETPNFWIGSTT